MTLPSQNEIRPVLLDVLATAGGHARPSEVYPLITARFQIDPLDLTLTVRDGSRSLWTNRIQFVRQGLVDEGLIDGTQRGVWQLTDAGRRAAQEPSLLPSDSAVDGAEDAPTEPEEMPHGPTEADSGLIAGVIAELRAAATDSGNPSRLEEACGAAFRALGFGADVVGGAGNTDVVVTAPLGVHQYTAVVDAKSTGHGHVANAQVNWLAIRQHRDNLNADFACVIGPSFGGGNLIEHATEFRIALLSVVELSELLGLHAAAPFALTELRLLFESSPLAGAALPQLRILARDRRRFQALVDQVLTLIDNFNRVQPDLVVAKPETLQALVLNSSDDRLAGTTIGEMTRVLALLEAAGVLAPLPSGGFASVTSVSGAVRRIESLVPNRPE